MTEDTDLSEDVFPDSKYSIQVPTMPGIRTVWDVVIEKHGEELVGSLREILPDHTGSDQDLLYRYEVAEEFLKYNREDVTIRGGKEKSQAKLEKAIQTVSDSNDVGYETVRQACVRPYSDSNRNQKLRDDFERLAEEVI
ncbi:hypothetical protein [Halobellus rubicundus]|uniref:Uncharacterized protein n=1 Tax=Halobellus rubicundus TaxID=2996466 RepID=A0ABD5MDC9_9EURY